MKRMACGTAATIALVGLAACFSNPALDLNTGNFHIVQPTPLVMFTKVGDSIQLRLRLVNDANNGTITSFTIASIGTGISVRYDDKFRPYYFGGDTLSVPVDKTMQQYYVKGLAPGKWTFTATATANPSAPAATVTVTVESKDLGAALSRTTGLNAGDTVTITAPAGLVFSQTSAVTFATGAGGIASRSADSTSLRVVVGPGVSGVATVTKVGTAANPVIGTQTLSTTNAITLVPAINLGAALNPTSGLSAGSPVTVTAPAGMVFSQTSAVTLAAGAVAVTARSADSTTITFVVGPGASGVATVTKVGLLNGVVLGTFTLSTTNSIAPVANVTIAPTTLSSATPAFGASMTVTLGGSLRFLAGSKILIGGNQGFILSVSADSSTATYVPIGGASGTVTYTGIALSFLNSVALSVPGDKTATVGAPASDPNATSLATASTFAMPTAVGQTVVLADGASSWATGGVCGSYLGGDGCRYYKIVVTGTGTYSLELRWNTAVVTDLGGYLLNAAGTALGNGGYADANGDQAGGPETGTWSGLAAGTYYIAIAQWGGGSPSYQLAIKRTS